MSAASIRMAIIHREEEEEDNMGIVTSHLVIHLISRNIHLCKSRILKLHPHTGNMDPIFLMNGMCMMSGPDRSPRHRIRGVKVMRTRRPRWIRWMVCVVSRGNTGNRRMDRTKVQVLKMMRWRNMAP